jgi:flagellar hook assembly protein FlgD
VRVLVSEVQEAGAHTVEWDGRNAAGAMITSGLYFVRLESGGVSDVRRLARVR